MKKPLYPFQPKSTKWLLPGQFWSIPLSNGTFACGRVIALKPKPTDRYASRAFLCGLLDWNSDRTPTCENIEGAKVLKQGQAHIKTIVETGGEILGFRALSADNIEPQLFLSQAPDSPSCMVQRGFEILRPASSIDRATLPPYSTWGFHVIRVLAEKQFVENQRRFLRLRSGQAPTAATLRGFAFGD